MHCHPLLSLLLLQLLLTSRASPATPPPRAAVRCLAWVVKGLSMASHNTPAVDDALAALVAVTRAGRPTVVLGPSGVPVSTGAGAGAGVAVGAQVRLAGQAHPRWSLGVCGSCYASVAW